MMLFDNCCNSHGAVARQVFNGLSSLSVLTSKLVFHTDARYKLVNNSVVSDLYFQSPLFKRWRHDAMFFSNLLLYVSFSLLFFHTVLLLVFSWASSLSVKINK